jgi:hypothetical protein
MHIAGLLPEGNILMPNKQLHVEWFHMTFHKSDHVEYVQSGRKLSNETLQTIAEYFQLIHETCENDGSLMHHQIEKIRMKQYASYAASWRNGMRIRNAFSLTSVGATGQTIDATAATIVLSMADACSASSATTAVATMTNTTTGRVPSSAKTMTPSPVASTAGTPSTHTKSAVPTRSIKRNCVQTTTSTGTKVAITTTIATRVATMSHAGARILPCPATATQVRATRAKPRRIYT